MQDVNMTEEEITKHLEETLTVRVVTITPEGKSHAVPLWFVTLNGDIYITTTKRTKKAKNILANNNLSLLFDQGEESDMRKLWGIVIEGKAEEATYETTIKRFYEAYGKKYFGQNYLDHPGYQQISNMPERVVFKIKQEKIATWDYSKMG
jgi:nitroimidazol reductase NimA-like FMN-containing flavoprotein (pyridoxamine 5'-phosphate oxidase superfamily)